ncbi:MAG: hypothetical protein M5R42_11580 [Rhodocyclaceae bacterium]|nr:hypothetical protein [Rhodocyclaceae bacterium]
MAPRLKRICERAALRGAKRHTFNELVDEYEADAEKNLRSFADRKKHLAYWREAFGADLLSDITVTRIKREREKLLGNRHAIPLAPLATLVLIRCGRWERVPA